MTLQKWIVVSRSKIDRYNTKKEDTDVWYLKTYVTRYVQCQRVGIRGMRSPRVNRLARTP